MLLNLSFISSKTAILKLILAQEEKRQESDYDTRRLQTRKNDSNVSWMQLFII